MSAKPLTIDEHRAPLSHEKRAALEKLRRTSRSPAPKAEECISYRIPAFRLGRRMADSPLPATLVRKLVKTRITEKAAQQPVAADGATRRRTDRANG